MVPFIPPLFVYGTLRDPELRAAVIGRQLAPDRVLRAAAPGFIVLHYPGRSYPALVRAPGGAAEGLLLLGLSPFEQDLLDTYEGPEYRPAVIAVMTGEELHESCAYLPAVNVPAGTAEWRLETWQEQHKPKAVEAEAAAAQMLRAKLIAIRPN